MSYYKANVLLIEVAYSRHLEDLINILNKKNEAYLQGFTFICSF